MLEIYSPTKPINIRLNENILRVLNSNQLKHQSLLKYSCQILKLYEVGQFRHMPEKGSTNSETLYGQNYMFKH